MQYRLLTEFEGLFAGHEYRHRDSSRGDFIAMHLYEDLVNLNTSSKLVTRVTTRTQVISTQNLRQGIQARRGDGTFGEIVPGSKSVIDLGYVVARGRLATIEIGTEVKIVNKTMIRQIDRVTGDLRKQVDHFQRGGGQPISVAIVGVNHAPYAVSYEGNLKYTTNGKKDRHPIQEASETTRRLLSDAAPAYNEFIVLHYSATNEAPFTFTWVNYGTTFADYGAALVRISREYDRRF